MQNGDPGRRELPEAGQDQSNALRKLLAKQLPPPSVGATSTCASSVVGISTLFVILDKVMGGIDLLFHRMPSLIHDLQYACHCTVKLWKRVVYKEECISAFMLLSGTSHRNPWGLSKCRLTGRSWLRGRSWAHLGMPASVRCWPAAWAVSAVMGPPLLNHLMSWRRLSSQSPPHHHPWVRCLPFLSQSAHALQRLCSCCLAGQFIL